MAAMMDRPVAVADRPVGLEGRRMAPAEVASAVARAMSVADVGPALPSAARARREMAATSANASRPGPGSARRPRVRSAEVAVPQRVVVGAAPVEQQAVGVALDRLAGAAPELRALEGRACCAAAPDARLATPVVTTRRGMERARPRPRSVSARPLRATVNSPARWAAPATSRHRVAVWPAPSAASVSRRRPRALSFTSRYAAATASPTATTASGAGPSPNLITRVRVRVPTPAVVSDAHRGENREGRGGGARRIRSDRNGRPLVENQPVDSELAHRFGELREVDGLDDVAVGA